MLIAGATATSHVANDFAEDEQNFVKLTEGMTEVSNNKLKLMKFPKFLLKLIRQF